jgi:hypothetical protein
MITPMLLDIMGAIRPGDTEKLDAIIEMIDFSMPDELTDVDEGDELFEFVPSEDQDMIRMKAVLRRYRGMAARMEATSK